MSISFDLSPFSAGTYIVEDDGVLGNGVARLRFPDGTFIPFVIPADFLQITAEAGQIVIFNLVESMGTADVIVGDLANSTLNPDQIRVRTLTTTGDVTLVANGAILEGGNDAAADIVATRLIMSATGGVGTGSNAIETQVSFMEAETLTGGINIRNFGSVQIGGVTDLVDGLDVETSGNLIFTALGSIFLSDFDLDAGNPPTAPLETVHGGNVSGNVTLTATGFDSDIIASTDTDAITAPRGDINLTAGRDIAFGTIGANFDNDVRANGNVNINAGQDFLIDGFSDLRSDDFGQNTGGDVVINVGRNIHLRNIAGDDATVAASGSADGNVVLTTGFGGALILDAPSPTALGASSGNVLVNADRILISASSGINVPGGEVVLNPATAGRDIILGSTTDAAFALELSDAELDRIFTPTLNIGSATAGRLDVTTAISPLNATNLVLRSGTDLTVAAAMTVGGALTLRAGDNLFQLAASAITAGGTFQGFVDEAGDDGGVGGVGILNGTATATSVTLVGNFEADRLDGNGGSNALFGFGGSDRLRGFDGGDFLDGGAGADVMVGGLGDDIFVVDNGGDEVDESVGEGTDLVQSSISYLLTSNVEDLTLTGVADLNGTGNDLVNELIGNNGANVLNGGAGADDMRAGNGNDTYIVDNVGDIALDSGGASGGVDLVQSSVTFEISTNIENLTLTGASAIDGTGNSLINIINGNGAANLIDGKGGADTMNGFGGNDTYVVNEAGDTITDNSGVDTVRSTINYTLQPGLENLLLLGSAGLSGNGNSAANTITGNAGANTLDGLAHNDILLGLAGIDTLLGDAGNDTLHGGTGSDVLTGGTGTDGFRFDTALNAASNVDDITDFAVADDTIFLDRDIFTGIAADGTLAAGAFRAGTVAVDADDRILYDSATGQIRYDADGVGGAAAILFAIVDPATALTNADFVGYV